MNKQRYERLLQLIGLLQEILDEEQEYYENIPENLQSSERAENSAEIISILEDVICNLENICY